MFKRFFLFAVSAAIFISCGNSGADRNIARTPVFESDECESTENILVDLEKLSEENLDTPRNDESITLIQDTTSEDGIRSIYALPCIKVCSTMIGVAVKDGVILEATFVRGCPGNTIGIGKLVKGMNVDDAISKLEGIDCSERGTSCPDQLTEVLKLFK